jgi:4-diphosphocytidyl-2-C-methyl-D-erythritol kinase
MSSTQTKLLTVFAPAKINLYLHVTGRLDNGYHTLDSLIAFADIGDSIDIEPAADFQFRVRGVQAARFTAKERDASPNSSNLAVQAAWTLALAAQKTLNLRITLTKNLPLASGIGGGSSDAAAVIWGLCEWWDIPRDAHYLSGLMARLGADVPVCFGCKTARVRGIGDVIDPVPPIGETAIVLVNPGKPCPTPKVFARFSGTYREPIPLPLSLENFKELVAFIRATSNDLQDAACDIEPEIRIALQELDAQKGCALARMTGSGATCFGLFENDALAQKAAKAIAAKNKGWWAKAGWLNRPERY